MEKEPTEIQPAQNLTEKEVLPMQPMDDHEHVVDIENPEIKKAIEASERTFLEFIRKYGYEFDLSKEESVDRVLEAAKEEGIFQQAQSMRELIYDKNLSIYGVCYISNVCNQNCTFCPMGIVNAEVEAKRDQLRIGDVSEKEKARLQSEIADYESKLQTMTPKEAEQDMTALTSIGHKEICVLSGEKIAHDPSLVAQYLQIAANRPGVREVIMNMGSYNERVFKWIKDEVKAPPGVKLQHRVFQETYYDMYGHFMRKAPRDERGAAMPGSKLDWQLRRDSQINALKAGFDEVGIGALFGLLSHPLLEIKALREHAKEIKEQGGKEPKRCCLPLGNEPEYTKVEIPYAIARQKRAMEITELIYALSRLAMPTVSIVSSERDGPEMLRILDQYANHTTLFVHPGPRQNIESLKELEGASKKEGEVIEQAKVTSRNPKEQINYWLENGYHVLGFDWQKYLNPEELANSTV